MHLKLKEKDVLLLFLIAHNTATPRPRIYIGYFKGSPSFKIVYLDYYVIIFELYQ